MGDPVHRVITRIQLFREAAGVPAMADCGTCEIAGREGAGVPAIAGCRAYEIAGTAAPYRTGAGATGSV